MKKVLVIFLSLIMVFAATACENPSNEPQATPPPKTAQAPQNPKDDEIISRDVTLYFPDEAVMYLVPEKINVNALESIFVESIVSALIKGPVSEDLNPAILGDVDIFSVNVKDGLCTLDLSSEFRRFNTGGSTKETMAIYSIVNTLCGLDEIDKVKINIEGEENPDFGGHYSLDEPFEADESLIAPKK